MQGQESQLGFSGLILSFPCHPRPNPRWPLVSLQAPLPPPPPDFSFPDGKAHTILSVSLEERKQAAWRQGDGHGDLGRTFLKESPRNRFSQGDSGVWGNQDGLCWLALPRLPVSNLSPTLYTDVSLLLAFCATLLTFQDLSRAELSAGALRPRAPGRDLSSSSSNCWSPLLSPAHPPPPQLGKAFLDDLRGRRRGEERDGISLGGDDVLQVESVGWL